jgi:hypothetical protein
MWIDYAIYLTTGLVLLAVIGLIVVLARNRAGRGTVIGLVVVLVVGLLGTFLARPERFRTPGDELLIVEVDGALQTEVALIGSCLSIFRRVGPLSFIVGNDLFPGDTWDRGPFSGCDDVGNSGAVKLPASVESGEWMLCDSSTCHPLR